MKEVIEVKPHATLIQAVSARDLYLGLGLAKDQWSRWYKANIENNDFFKESQDWVGFDIVSSGNETRDFAISIDFAKHISMMAKTKKSHEYRGYFIECEKKLIAQPTLNPANLSRLQLIQLALEAEQELQEAKQEIAVLEPKALALDRISGSDGTMCLTDAAKNLSVPPQKLNGALSFNKWMFKRSGGSHWIAYQDKIQAGYLDHKTYPVKLPDGTEKITQQVRVTAKGLAKLSCLVSQWGM